MSISKQTVRRSYPPCTTTTKKKKKKRTIALISPVLTQILIGASFSSAWVLLSPGWSALAAIVVSNVIGKQFSKTHPSSGLCAEILAVTRSTWESTNASVKHRSANRGRTDARSNCGTAIATCFLACLDFFLFVFFFFFFFFFFFVSPRNYILVVVRAVIDTKGRTCEHRPSLPH